MSIYSDVSHNSCQRITDFDSVLQSLENILFTNQQERLFRPDFGASLEDLPFELDIQNVRTILIHNLVASLQDDPRILFEPGLTALEPVEGDPNKYKISVYFGIAGFPDTTYEYHAVISR